MRFQHAIFDLDGTILDSMPGIRDSLAYACKRTGYSLDLADCRRFVGPPIHDMIALEGKLSPDQTDEFVRHFRKYNGEKGLYNASYFPGVKEALFRLKRAGLKLYIATSKPEAFAERMAAHYGFGEYFDRIAGASQEAGRSEKTQVLNYLFEQCVINKDSAVMIGDRKYDLIGGRNVGIETIGVAYGYAAPGELEQFAPYAIVAGPSELGDLLLGT